ncbi:MAG: trypsin, partial [Gammaproteobacteria bacterium]
MALVVIALLSVPVVAGPVSKLFQRVSPAVVVLHTFEQAPPIFKDGEITTASVEGVGSGVLISADGLILTAAHVVHIADSIHVEFHDGSRTLGRVLASDKSADVALISIDRVPDGITPVSLADSDQVAVGDEIIVIGAPYGIGHTLSVGHISGRRVPDDDSMFSGTELFQTDAAINQGNSGGPLFTLDGEVAGIVSHILSRSGGYEGMGFAVTANTARELLLERRGLWSGIDGVLLEGSMAAAFNMPATA